MKVVLAIFTFAFCIFNFQFSKAQNIGIGTNTPMHQLHLMLHQPTVVFYLPA